MNNKNYDDGYNDALQDIIEGLADNLEPIYIDEDGDRVYYDEEDLIYYINSCKITEEVV